MTTPTEEPLTDLLAEARGGVCVVPLVTGGVTAGYVWLRRRTPPGSSPTYIDFPLTQWPALVAQVNAQLPNQSSALPQFAGTEVPA